MWPGNNLVAQPFKPEFYPLRLELGSHGVVIFANYGLNALITGVRSPPDMPVYTLHSLSKPVGPVYFIQKDHKIKGFSVPNQLNKQQPNTTFIQIKASHAMTASLWVSKTKAPPYQFHVIVTLA